ncbi:hypothetical protein VCX83_21410 [Aeromonas caviae]|uniref:hypothetical protein n=1 Tax=Aeromonas caviae TaxID=648 RepID=UPI002B2460DA|nr:hypothetical protein [Aeromonas caviae]MEA9424387.1 hypothetical protein [Aeromonas caviae]
MQISQVESASHLAQKELRDSYGGLLAHSSSLTSQVSQHIEEWKRDTEAALTNECPFAEHAHKLNHWRRESALGDISKASFQVSIHQDGVDGISSAGMG